MGPITFGLGLACVLAAAFTLIGRDRRRDHDDGTLAIAFTQVWAFGAGLQMAGQLLPPMLPPFFVWFNPPIDVAVALYIWRHHRARPTGWKRVAFVLQAFQLTMHVAYGLALVRGDTSRETLNAYKFALNVSFLASLGCIMWPGGKFGVRRLFARLPSGVGRLGQRGREAQ